MTARPPLLPPPGHAGGRLRVLAVHAHPDDETLATGIALAHHAARGDAVHVITATLGEEGEVIPPELAHLEGAAALGRHRHGELRRAMRVLAVAQEYLGGEVPRWRDSGMAGSPAARHLRAFASAEVLEAAEVLLGRLRALRPDIVLTYDEHGGYGHPDHIQAHRVTVAAVRALPEPERPALYAVLTPRSWAQEDRTWLAEHVDPATALTVPAPEDAYPPSVVPDDHVGHEVADASALRAQSAALAEHRTQVAVYDGYYALSNAIAARLAGREGYARIPVADHAPGGEPRA